MIEFGILGPLEARRDGETVRISGDRERALLALLLTHAGEVVSADRLVEEIWGERPPENASNALQAVVSRLRKTLGASDVLVTRKPGYVIELSPEQLDASRFERGVERARAIRDDDAWTAARVLSEALSLWRGRPLADLAFEDLARQEITRLEELRSAALEERIDAYLAVSRHQEAVAELEGLIAEYPLRERFRAQLMIALYRSGRQGDAVNAYQDARRTLDEELGLDPGPELQQLYQLILRQDPSLAPSPVAAQPVAGNLPERITPFVGRERDVEAVSELVDHYRLVTVAGPGGAGKTSLAIEVGRSLQEALARGAWLVELASIQHPDLVVGAVADAVGLSEAGSGSNEARSQAERLLAYLRNKEMMLILDNCEHVVQAAAELSESLLSGCPKLKILATSREVLGLTGESVWTIPPLSLPGPEVDVDKLASYDAVRLFELRAAAARAGFALEAETAPVAAHICRRLDGMPLPIELAAARVRSLPVKEIAARLDDRFALLTGGGRTAPPRHRTLRATIDWSHDLLDDDEKALFRRLSVFSDGWDLAAAEDVAAGGDVDAAGILDLLTGLADRSLVVADPERTPRFRMLETLKQYARDRLEQAGEKEELERRHAYHYLAVAERAEEPLRGPDQGDWLVRLKTEQGNLRAALEWGIKRASTDGELSLRMAGALGWFWFLERHDEGREFLKRILEASDSERSQARARALQSYSVVFRPGACVVHPHATCAEAARSSLELFEALGDRRRSALSKALLAVEGIGGHLDNDALLDEAMEEFRLLGDRWGQALCHFVRMEIGFRRGEFEGALADGEVAMETFRSLGDRWGSSAVMTHMGEALRHSGRIEEAAEAYERALAEARRVGLPNVVQWLLAGLGSTSFERGDVERARVQFREAQLAAEEVGEGSAKGLGRLGEGLIARAEGDIGAARARFEEALALFERQRMPVGVAWALRALGSCERLDGDLERAESTQRRGLEVARRAGEPPAVAAALEGVATTLAARGRAEEVAELLGAAANVRAGIYLLASRFEKHEIEGAEADARAQLGSERYEALFNRGSAKDPKQVAASI